jgi:transcriptional regulator with XRE-family HTH domain
MSASDQIQKEFGERVRYLRKRRGLSQEEFSFACSLDRTYVSQVEQGRRNISLQNIKGMADALDVSLADLFAVSLEATGGVALGEPRYRIKENFSINCGFRVTGAEVKKAVIETGELLQGFPFSLYQSIDLKTLSSIVGAVFVESLAAQVGAIVNPIEKGHPDIIPLDGRTAREAKLRNYPQGLEVKVTVGNVKQGSDLQPGQPRINMLTALTWQAHHREVKSLMGLVVDFAGASQGNKRFPLITGVFFTDLLKVDDWGEISGTTGRNTKVTGMRSSGKAKMGSGWILLLDETDHLSKYASLLKF